jgi:hypothetical protein
MKKIYYNNIKGLLKSDIIFDYTEEQLKEIVLCSTNIEYFLETYVKIVHQDLGIVPFKLYDYESELIKLFQTKKRVISLQSRQSGKCINFFSTVNIIKKPTGFKKLLLICLNFCWINFNEKI